MTPLFLFVRPPRPLWPFNGPGSAFWPPLAFASLAAALRQAAPRVRVMILDAAAMHMGWCSLESRLRELRPTYVGIGEEAVSCVEGLRLAALGKQLGARVIAGGCFFGNVADELLATGLVDVVVHGEGEVTIGEMVAALESRDPSALHDVAGISFLSEERTVFTGPRPLIDDLDRLPLPAYDLLPWERYGRGSRNHPDLGVMELSRGCSSHCDFCVLWRQMARFRGSQPVPTVRTKSVPRLLEEVGILARKYGRRYLGWVDPCFNADASVPGELARQMLREGLSVGQSAWVRADGLVRDAASGALGDSVESGLNEVFIGIERPEQAGLKTLHKGLDVDNVRQAVRILADDYPQVFKVGSFIYGLPGDTARTVRSMYRFAHELDLDMTFYIPLTPMPGTPYWKPQDWDPTGEAFRHFDFLPQVDGDPLQAALTSALHRCFLFSWPRVRIRWLLRGLFDRSPRRRSIIRRHAIRGLHLSLIGATQSLIGRGQVEAMRFPSWYDQ